MVGPLSTFMIGSIHSLQRRLVSSFARYSLVFSMSSVSK